MRRARIYRPLAIFLGVGSGHHIEQYAKDDTDI